MSAYDQSHAAMDAASKPAPQIDEMEALSQVVDRLTPSVFMVCALGACRACGAETRSAALHYCDVCELIGLRRLAARLSAAPPTTDPNASAGGGMRVRDFKIASWLVCWACWMGGQFFGVGTALLDDGDRAGLAFVGAAFLLLGGVVYYSRRIWRDLHPPDPRTPPERPATLPGQSPAGAA